MAPGQRPEIVEFIQALTRLDSQQKLILSGVSLFGLQVFALLRHGYEHLHLVRMSGGLCENILNDPFGQLAGALILFLNNLDQSSRFNINLDFYTHFRLVIRDRGQSLNSE